MTRRAAVLLAICIVGLVGAWKTFEEPIPLTVTTPNSKGVYEFDLELRSFLTMSAPQQHGELNERSILDYDPRRMAWLERNKDQLGPCIDNRTLIDETKVCRLGRAGYAHRVEQLLAGVSQHLGTHVRLTAVNGQTPGPTLVVPFGAEVLIQIRNRQLLESVTLHVHGLDFRGAWFNGGVGYVQQCPIPPMSDFSFRFRADRVGTHWYHGEYPYHTANGLLGAFIVLPPTDEKHKFTKSSEENNESAKEAGYERDYVMLLQDWPVATSERQHEQYSRMTTRWAYEYDRQPSSSDGAPYCLRPGELNGVPNYQSLPLLGVLVNSKGWHSQRDIRTRPSRLPLTTYAVSTGDRVRLRVIHGGYDVPMFLHVEDHRITVVATDGTPIKPITVDKLMIYPGERYDVRVDVTSQPTRKIYRVVVRTEDAYYQPGLGASDEPLPYWSEQYAKPTHAPIYALANLELANVALPADGLDNDFTQASCRQVTAERCLALNCPYARIPGDTSNYASLPLDARHYRCVTVDALQRDADAYERNILGSTIHLKNFEEHFISTDPNSEIDGRIFVEPPRPLLYGSENSFEPNCDAICGDLSSTIFKGRPCRCFVYKRFRRDNIVQLTLYSMWQLTVRRKFTRHETLNIVGRPLSFHLHGTHFYVVKMGFATYYDNFTLAKSNEDLACAVNEVRSAIGCITNRWSDSTWHYGNIPNVNHQAVLKDTVVIPYGGYVTIRFRATNPGWWMAESTNANYNDCGTKFAYAIGDDVDMPSPPDDFPRSYCGCFDNPQFPEQ